MKPWFEKHRYFLDFTLSSLLRRKGKNAALILVYTLVVLQISYVVFFSSALRTEAKAVLAETPEMIVQRMVAGRHDLISLAHISKIEQIPGVREVLPRLWGYYFHMATRANYTIMATEPFGHKDDEIIAGTGVLASWNKKVGDICFFRGHDGEAIQLRVAEALSSSADLVAADLILVSTAAFQKLFAIQEGFATDLLVRIGNPREGETIAEKIMKILPDTRPILKAEILRTYDSIFDWRSGYILVLLSSAAFAFFVFAWDRATGLSAEEKLEIGILKAIGWDSSDIMLVKFYESAVISLTAFITGVIAAFVLLFFGSFQIFGHALKGWSVIYPTFRLSPSMDFYQLATLFCIAVMPYLLITVIPAWKVSITEPSSVMQQG